MLDELRKRNKDTQEALKQFEDLIAKNESIFEEAMKSLNDSIQSAQELIKRHIQSTIYFKRTDLLPIETESEDEEDQEEDVSSFKEEANQNVVGVFFHANWYLSSNQINFIKFKFLKNELTKDIQLSLDEVSLKNISNIKLIYN